MSRAIIVAASQRRVEEPKDPIPAIDRFKGVYFRILKKYLRSGKLSNTDILIVSQDFGVVRSKDKVPYRKPTNKLDFHKEFVEKARKANLKTLGRIFREKNYNEVYVNVGKEFYKLIEGFESLASAKIIHASGPGLGPKAKHMKNWILEQATKL
jgi:cytoplasmic iron level regulating protein YaaA (DUF328/UPF0246 family)